MCGDLKSVEFPKFDFYYNTAGKKELTCSYSFKAQGPADKSLLIRAILITFDAESDDDTAHFHAQCRVVFEFSDTREIPKENDFIEENSGAAYEEFCRKTNEVLVSLGQNVFDFKEI